MRILITAAEREELDCAISALRKVNKDNDYKHKVDFMLTGIGATSTAYKVTKQIYSAKLEGEPYSMALNIGIAGSFNFDRFPMGSVGVVESEYFGDLGFETFTGFQTLFDYKILESETFPYRGGALLQSKTMDEFGNDNVSLLINGFTSKINKAVGVTVQTVSGRPEKVEQVYSLFTPHIESMEGAAFYYVSIWEHLPAFELRSVSNLVGERDRSKWNIPLALRALETETERFFREAQNY